MILTASYNVYPAEPERLLCKHLSVALAAIGGESNEVRCEFAEASKVLKPQSSATGRALVNHSRQLKHINAGSREDD